MRTLDAVSLIKRLKVRRKPDQEWLDEHDGEFDDLVYEESVGREQSRLDGSMLGTPYDRGRFTG